MTTVDQVQALRFGRGACAAREDDPPVEHGPADVARGDVVEVDGQQIAAPYVRGRRFGHRGAALFRGWFHSERVRPVGFHDGPMDTAPPGPRHRPDPLRLRPLWRVERDWYHGYCAGPAARPPSSYGTRSRCERLLGRTGTASLAEATALARRDGPPRPSSEDLDHFVERHPGR